MKDIIDDSDNKYYEFLERKKNKTRIKKKSKSIGLKMTQCSFCDKIFPIKDKKCPNCNSFYV